MFLPRHDVERLTGCQRFAAQRRALDRLGIRYTLAATGEPLVREEEFAAANAQRRHGPRWDRMVA